MIFLVCAWLFIALALCAEYLADLAAYDHTPQEQVWAIGLRLLWPAVFLFCLVMIGWNLLAVWREDRLR